MNKFISLFGVLCLAVLSSYADQSAHLKRIAITQIVEHPSLDKIRQGITDELRDAGFIDGKTCEIIYENAQGNISVAAQIAQKFVSLDPAVIIAITTPSAQTVQQAVKSTKIPVIFGAVTDPVTAQLINSLDDNGGNITGTIDMPAATEQLEGILNFLPQLQILAVMFSPSEPNSLKQIEMMEQATRKHHISIIRVPVLKTADAGTATQLAADQAEAIFIPNDNTVISALDAVLQIAAQHNIPVFTSDPDSVERGALAAIANDQYIVGRETGKLAVGILKNKNASDIPVKIVSQVKSYINEKRAAILGLKQQ
jgi:putative ABC transport system substrate-binding protein